MTIDFTIRQNATGKSVVYADTYDDDYPLHTVEFLWSEGNYSCDCNRGSFFGDDDEDPKCSDGKYTVTRAVVRETGLVICDGDENWITPDPT